jgi:ABC-type nitrate/sulfonate/bicarbonate transport system permease component
VASGTTAAITPPEPAGSRWLATAVLLRGLPVAKSLLAAVLIWWLVARLIDRPLSLPGPLAVFPAWWDLLVSGDLVAESLVSLRRLGFAYVLAAGVGISLGLAMARWRAVDFAIGPIVNSVRAISGIAWIPIAVVWFGVGEELPIFIIFYGAVFPFILNAQAGLRNIDDRLITVARSLGARPLRITLLIVLPAALPYLLTGARIALGLAWMSIIAAELLGAPSGLGFSIQYARMIQQTPKMLAWILWVGALGYFLDAAMRSAVAALAPWSTAGRIEGGDR